MHIGNIRLLNVFEKGPVTVKMPISSYSHRVLLTFLFFPILQTDIDNKHNSTNVRV